MKAKRWCEIIVPSILPTVVMALWVAPVYANYSNESVQEKRSGDSSQVLIAGSADLSPVVVTDPRYESSKADSVPTIGFTDGTSTPLSVTPLGKSSDTPLLTLSLDIPLLSLVDVASLVDSLVDPGQDRGRFPVPTNFLTQASQSGHSVLAQANNSFLVTQIKVTGNTAVSDADISAITQPVIGTQAKLQDLQAVADGITQLYLDRGYITSRAILDEQTVVNGVVAIKVVEGGLEEIIIEGTRRVSNQYVRDRVALGGTTPLRQDRLEDQLRLLRSDPLFDNVEASLRAGKTFGNSILTVRVVEANPFFANLSADNYSPPSVGSEKLGIGAGYRNLTGVGDQFAASYSFSTTSGSSLFNFSYLYPLNAMNGTLQVRIAPSSYRITDPTFAAFGIRGNTDLYELVYRQPLLRSPREEFALSLGFAYQTGQTFLFNNIPQPFGVGPDANGISTTSVLRFGQDYVSRDVQGAWSVRSQFNLGLGIFGATSNASPVPDGQFFSWLLQGQRVQLLTPDQVLIIQADLQLTPDTLLPSQQFVIGGGQSVRGFRQNVRSGDNGARLSIENRITVQRDEAGLALVQLAPFVDMGTVWNTAGNPNQLPNQTFIAAAGVGFLWEPLPRLNIRLDYAIPFINLNDRSTNVQDSAFYFSVNYGI